MKHLIASLITGLIIITIPIWLIPYIIGQIFYPTYLSIHDFLWDTNLRKEYDYTCGGDF